MDGSCAGPRHIVMTFYGTGVASDAKVPTAISVSVGLVIRFICPVPAGWVRQDALAAFSSKDLVLHA